MELTKDLLEFRQMVETAFPEFRSDLLYVGIYLDRQTGSIRYSAKIWHEGDGKYYRMPNTEDELAMKASSPQEAIDQLRERVKRHVSGSKAIGTFAERNAASDKKMLSECLDAEERYLRKDVLYQVMVKFTVSRQAADMLITHWTATELLVRRGKGRKMRYLLNNN